MAILHINKSDSHCECSFKGISPYAKTCPTCREEFDTVTSDYSGGGIERAVMRMRPDLEPHFPWYDWYNTPEGQQTLEEFRVQLQMDENQELDSSGIND